MQLASCLEGGPLILMMPLYPHLDQKSDYDDYEICTQFSIYLIPSLNISAKNYTDSKMRTVFEHFKAIVYDFKCLGNKCGCQEKEKMC